MNNSSTPLSQALLLTPSFSKYQLLEGTIVDIYLSKAMRKYSPSPKIYTLVQNTPWILFEIFSIRSNTLIDPTISYQQQHTILAIALTASVLELANRSDFVFVNGNGPVVNEGFSTIIGALYTVGKPLVYWKDDARRLWGGYDNPLTLGLISPVSGAIVAPIKRLNALDDTQPTTCGPEQFTGLIEQALANSVNAGGTFSARLTRLVALGADINKLTETKPGIGDTFPSTPQAFQKIKTIVLNNIHALAATDQALLAPLIPSPAPAAPVLVN